MQNNIFLGLFVGHNTVTLKEVDSTNTYLRQALSNSEPLPEGTVIMAEAQLAGRGQTQNVWLSESGKNLTISILLNPRFVPVQQQFDLNMAICLAVNDVLTQYFPGRAKIKWPNDCYIDHDKVGGILIENLVQGNVIKHAIIGIGLNVNQASFPSALQNVTSFKKILHTDYDLQMIMNEICRSVEARYLQLKAGKLSLLRADYLSKLYLKDEWAYFRINEQTVAGKICDVSYEGLLVVETETGLQRFGFKEIEFIKQ